MLFYKDGIFYKYIDPSFNPMMQRWGWKWNKENQVWFTYEIKIVQKSKSVLTRPDLKVLYNAEDKVKVRILESTAISTMSQRIKYPDNGYTPFGYQLAGVEYALKRKSTLIADEMGLGKTMQAILFCNSIEAKRVVIVCPASLKQNWLEEWNRWSTLKTDPKIIDGQSKYHHGTNIVIINYDILHKFVKQFTNIDVIILDEAHYLKNSKAKRTQCLFGVWGKTKPVEAKYKIAITGTPIPNGRPIEMFPLLKYLDPINFNNKSDFAKRFCDAGIDEHGRWVSSGASNLDELNAFLRSTVMVRRMKAQVLKQLLPKIRQVIYLDADEKTKEILKFQNNIIGNIPYVKSQHSSDWILDEEAFTKTIRALPAGDMSNLMALRKEAALAKMPQAIEHYKERLEGFNKILIFAHHTEVIRSLQKAFPDNSVMIDGSVAPEKRQAIVNEFNHNPNINIFIGQDQAAGVGLNLTSGQLVSFMEECLRPGDTSQCEDRAHRIGQQGSILVEHLILKDSMDAAIAKMVIEKQTNIEKGINRKEC